MGNATPKIADSLYTPLLLLWSHERGLGMLAQICSVFCHLIGQPRKLVAEFFLEAGMAQSASEQP